MPNKGLWDTQDEQLALEWIGCEKIEFARLGLRLTKENLNDTVKIVSVVSGEICCAQPTQTI